MAPMRGLLLTAALAALVLAAPASAAPPVTLGKGPGGLLALDAAGGRVTAVIGRRDLDRPFALLTSDGRRVGRARPFGAFKGRDPEIVAFPGGAEVGWARVVNAGMEYSAASYVDGELGAASVLGKGTGPPQLTLVDGEPKIARSDALGNVTLGDGEIT